MRELTKIPGPMKVQILLLTTLTISSVTSTVLQISQRGSNISEESILHSVESLEVGSSAELKADIKNFGKSNFKREIISLHKTLGKVNYEETKQLFLHNVLMEALDDGTPAYYNSNILGRYMRKDYGSFESLGENSKGNT